MSSGGPSGRDGDTTLEVLRGTTTTVVTAVPVMVRVRKDAETLTVAERGRFLGAMARLNDRGRGPFRDFRNTHTDDTTDEAHGLDGFLPWHRAYLLDLERELQRIDPSVTLPYWRFDRPAPKLFAPPSSGRPIAGGQRPVCRRPTRCSCGPRTASRHRPHAASFARRHLGRRRPERRRCWPRRRSCRPRCPTPACGPAWRATRTARAHVSFGGSISDIGTAARDPLFFLLHCNVDRLWAKWQWFQRRFDATRDHHYPFARQRDEPTEHPDRPQRPRHDVAVEQRARRRCAR